MSIQDSGFGVVSNRASAYTGNLGVWTIQHSEIGRHPDSAFVEELPSKDSLTAMRENGLRGFEDYLCWGTMEEKAGKWNWEQHDRTQQLLSRLGIEYVVYPWIHFPPLWYADKYPEELMRCLEHDEPIRVVSFFSPRTLDAYREFYRRVHEHFGDKVAVMYACLNGPYGEGNFPLPHVDWVVNQGHSHEGWWIGDRYAQADFRRFVQERFSALKTLNAGWGTAFESFDKVDYPRAFCLGERQLDPENMTPEERRRWLDFCEWQQNVLPKFAKQVAELVLEFYPAERVKIKPGGSAGGINPLSWGTNCPGFAKELSGLAIGAQPADAHGAVFGDKWVYSAYRHYGIPFSSETAGAIDTHHQTRRIFSDASSGAIQLFTYEYEKHAPVVQKYIHLYQGRYPKTSVAVYAPITDFRLGRSLETTIHACQRLRDLTDFDVLDELLIRDGFLSKYTHLILFQAEWMESEVMEHIQQWQKRGGTTIAFVDKPTRGISGEPLPDYSSTLPASKASSESLEFLYELLPQGLDGVSDGLWLTEYLDGSLLVYNDGSDSVTRTIRHHGGDVEITVGSHEIVEIPSRGR